MSSAGAIHRLVVFGDACASATLGMAAKERMRGALYRAFAEAYDAVGVAPGAVHQEDRGDGILCAVPPDVPPTLMVGRWIDTLYESLREHNADRERRLRVRVGMNAGPVLDDGRGLVGRAVDLTCRLADSPAAKDVMVRAEDADLLVVVSDWLYVNVVCEGGRYVEPGHYRPARVRSKETDETAWFHIPRRAAPPLPPPDTGGAPGDGHPGEGGPPGTGTGAAAEGPAAAGRDGEGGEGGAAGGAPRTGGGPHRGDGPPPRTAATRPGRTYRAGGDLQVFEHNTIHGGFTGIRKDRGTGDGA